MLAYNQLLRLGRHALLPPPHAASSLGSTIGDRVIVRGEVTGTPAGELFGVAYSGKSFRMMAIDIQTIRDGKITKTYHMENWLSALNQLRAR